jgi:hypothetical protein
MHPWLYLRGGLGLASLELIRRVHLQRWVLQFLPTVQRGLSSK